MRIKHTTVDKDYPQTRQRTLQIRLGISIRRKKRPIKLHDNVNSALSQGATNLLQVGLKEEIKKQRNK